MKPRLIGLAVATILSCAAPFAGAAVFYRGLQNVSIPTDFTGVYLNIENGVTGSMEFTGWDINPFFGGYGVGTSAAFQPARIGTANSDPILALGTGVTVNGSLFYSSGQGGSEGHLGPGANRFGPGQEAYLGFRFTTDGNAGPFYGWMRVVFTANTPGGILKDWAYETSGSPLQTANVLQAAPSSGLSVVTLSGGLGQNSTLGSVVANLGGGNVTGLAKTGAGTWTLAGPQTYPFLIIADGVTNLNVSYPNATIESTGGTLNINASQTLNALTIGAGGVVTLLGSFPSMAGDAGSSTQPIPEPMSAGLLIGGCMVLVSQRHGRRPS